MVNLKPPVGSVQTQAPQLPDSLSAVVFLMVLKREPPVVRILTSDFNQAGLSYGSTAPADAKQAPVMMLLHLQEEQESGPSGAPLLAQVGPFTSWQCFNSATKLNSG